MKQIDFNSGWTFRALTDEGPGQSVTLPHDAMIGEPRVPDSPGANNTGYYRGRDYVYEKTFTAPAAWAGQTVLIEFEGVYRNAEVWLNGEQAAFRPYGYTNFTVDITKMVKLGEENSVRVIARNAEQPNSRWYSGAGIYRPVSLWTGGEKHILHDGVRVTTTDVSSGEVRIDVSTRGDGAVTARICSSERVVVSAQGESVNGKCALTVRVPDAALWDCDHPNLYTCRVTFADDDAHVTFGIRALAWNPTDGLTLNGQRVLLLGACIHHDNGLLGACAFPEAEERKVRILKSCGYNAIRSAHNPCSKALLDACDRLGMLVMDEYVDHWYIHKTKYDYVPYFMDWWRQDLNDMADKDYNHPSVILYSIGNEVSETAQPKGIELTREMVSHLHECDATRPVTCGINIFFNFLSSIGFGVYSDEKAEKEAKPRAQEAQQKKKPVGSAFYNALAAKVGDTFMKWGATLPPCDLKTRDAFAAMDIAGYNYGLFRYKHDLKKYPERLILGTETFCKDAYSFYELSRENPRLLGDFVWSGMDYLGETGDGCAEYADYRLDDGAPQTRMTGGNGRVDLLGHPRAEAAYTRVAFDIDPGPYIAVNPVYQTEKLTLTGWQLTKALESWSYRGCAGKRATVEVYARAASVSLQVNGKVVAKKKLKGKCRAVFEIPYEDGELTAIAYDADGKPLGKRSLITAGEETVLFVKPESPRVRPGHLAFIDLAYTDAQGVLKPMEKHTLTVRVSGGTLLGLGSANAYVEGNYTLDHTNTYYGEAQAVIRAGESGDVRVMVTDETGRETLAVLPVLEDA